MPRKDVEEEVGFYLICWEELLSSGEAVCSFDCRSKGVVWEKKKEGVEREGLYIVCFFL